MRLRHFFAPPDDPGAPPPPWWVRAGNLALVGVGVGLVLAFAFKHVHYRWNWAAIWPYREKLIRGWWTTIGLSLAALLLSVTLGLAAALARRSGWLMLRYTSRIYLEVVRGTPLLVQILIFFYVVANAFGLANRYVAGVLILAVFSGAYLAEIIRAGIESVGRSQLESARAIGLTRAQTYRYVVFPQALRQCLPPLAGQFASLVKDSSLLYTIGISEFTANAQDVNAYTFSTLESYLPLALGYLALTLPISLWTRRLEEQHRYET